MDRILGTDVLQRTNRNMRISIGDIPTFSAAAQSKTPTIAFLVETCRRVYMPNAFDRLIIDRLEATYATTTVFCWLFQNMAVPVAEKLHTKLAPDPAYLCAMDVNFSKPLHLGFFRNSLCENYRLYGNRSSVFFHMGENEDPDIAIREGFEKHGFTVDYEDIGARRTIFDNYDTLEHFKRIEDFKSVFAGFSNLDDDRVSDLALSLEELHPKLFDAFASAARTIQRAETEEDCAQAALSGRRLLERTADYLFPPQDVDWNGRKVGRPEYKNRLWAYIEQTITKLKIGNGNTLNCLGKEADRLVELFNAGLHAEPTRQKVEAAFTDLVIWLSQVIELAPAAVRRPNLAYEQALIDFMKDVTKKMGK